MRRKAYLLTSCAHMFCSSLTAGWLTNGETRTLSTTHSSHGTPQSHAVAGGLLVLWSALHHGERLSIWNSPRVVPYIAGGSQGGEGGVEEQPQMLVQVSESQYAKNFSPAEHLAQHGRIKHGRAGEALR